MGAAGAARSEARRTRRERPRQRDQRCLSRHLSWPGSRGPAVQAARRPEKLRRRLWPRRACLISCWAQVASDRQLACKTLQWSWGGTEDGSSGRATARTAAGSGGGKWGTQALAGECVPPSYSRVVCDFLEAPARRQRATEEAGCSGWASAMRCAVSSPACCSASTSDVHPRQPGRTRQRRPAMAAAAGELQAAASGGERQAAAGASSRLEVAVLGGEDYILSQRSGVEEELFKGQVGLFLPFCPMSYLSDVSRVMSSECFGLVDGHFAGCGQLQGRCLRQSAHPCGWTAGQPAGTHPCPGRFSEWMLTWLGWTSAGSRCCAGGGVVTCCTRASTHKM